MANEQAAPAKQAPEEVRGNKPAQQMQPKADPEQAEKPTPK